MESRKGQLTYNAYNKDAGIAKLLLARVIQGMEEREVKRMK